ncbi:hypothetical protein [Streptomyces sp. STR69]|uniref:hypothetical protein n=1 Tax=Streptomyces sp. STR69 TaxID=1796942 RepID=UPI0021CA3492|nr:hypothetical protein [Streptomyces sp. STR69]
MNEQWRQRQQPRALGQPPGSGRAPRPAVLVQELVTAAGTDGDEARECARRLAACLSPQARSVLLDALTEADPWHDDAPDGYGTGGGLSFEGPGCAVPPARSTLSLLPTYRAPGPDRPVAVPGPRDDPPAAVVRLRFADAGALDRAAAAFDGAWSDPGALTLQVPADAGVATLRAVLAVLDAAALAPESLTVHTNELDDVFAAFTGLL